MEAKAGGIKEGWRDGGEGRREGGRKGRERQEGVTGEISGAGREAGVWRKAL